MSKNINDIIANAQSTANQSTTASVVNDTQAVVQEPAQAVNAEVAQTHAIAPNTSGGNDLVDLSNLPPELQALIQSGASAPVRELGSQSKTTLGVDEWLQPDGMGLVGKGTRQILRPFKAWMNYTLGQDINWVKTIQIESTSPTGDTNYTYVSTADAEGKMGNDGRPWTASLIEAYQRNSNPKHKLPYDSAQVILHAAEDVLNLQGEVSYPKGTTFGHSTPRTGYNNIVDLENVICSKGLDGGFVEVEVSCEVISLKGRKPWGVLNYKLIGAYTPED